MPTRIFEQVPIIGQVRRVLAKSLEQRIKARAAAYGFDHCRITTPGALATAGNDLRAFIAAGYHGTMDWLADTLERRTNPKRLWLDCRSVIMLAANYGTGPEADPLARLSEKERGIIARYARGRDYHDVLKGRLKQVAGAFAGIEGGGGQGLRRYRTAPRKNRSRRQQASAGRANTPTWFPRDHGSWLFLGAILTTAVLEADPPETDHCGSCRRCLDACPTDAFPTPYQLDARRCISYLTIEYAGHVAQAFRRPIGNRVFGCDDCLAVCPLEQIRENGR